MKWPFSLFKKKNDDRADALLDRYRQLRKTAIALNTRLAKQVPKAAVPECAKKLGLAKAGTLIFNNDDEVGLLYDYCFHHYRRAGKNVVERHLEHAPPPAGSAEAELLQAMRQSRFSAFLIEAINPHTGAALRDLITGESFDLIDLGLSQTGTAGIVLIGRILPMGDFNLSSGTLVPLPLSIYEHSLAPVARKFLPDGGPKSHPLFSPAQEASFTAQMLRTALFVGGEDNTFFTDMDHPDWG